MTQVVADTHLHFYPCYDLKQGLNTLRKNLSLLSSEAVQLGFLAERHDCHFFRDICEGNLFNDDPSIEALPLGESVLLKQKGFNDLYLFAGRQIITQERLEILALTIDTDIPDGLPAEEVINRVREKGGISVLSWAPGKWFFKRGEIVNKIISEHNFSELAIGDTTLRPWCWPTPKLMAKAKKSGYSVLAGSDPLPFEGEENMMGCYASLWDFDFNHENPVQSVRSYIKGTKDVSVAVGGGSGLLQTLTRLYKNKKSK
ncbi:MAG: hypothetical protein KAR01_05635 [Desulfocapsa sp.]|nr:hypothetical protein [Desulfocapsa sp.]